MKRRTQTTLPRTRPSWIPESAWDRLVATPQGATDESPTACPKRKREKAVWRETTDLEKRAVAAYRTCYTPPWSFDRRLSRKMRDDQITEKIAKWLWFYVWKHRAQIGDTEVTREAIKRHETQDSLH